MKTDIPLGSQSEEIIIRAERLGRNMGEPSRLGDLTRDVFFLAGADLIRYPELPALVINGLRLIQSRHPDKFESLLIQAAEKAAPDSKLARLLTNEWLGLHIHASLEKRAVMFPEMYDAFKTAKSVNIREAAGTQVLSSCFQHATTDAKLSEIKLALADVRNFASEHHRKDLLHQTSAKIKDLREQEAHLERSLG